ncbi:MAG: hypothetical protein OXI22_07620 [Defluviicoccus sp.]|nr:hypothetical protein [Defluviicoccus sp.]MDE0383732.1 hypothetical protein [Defluviicoccus sp.]
MTDEARPPIPYADRAALPENLAAAVDAYERRMGFLPNALRLYMHRPELLACLIRLNDTAMRDDSGHLDRGLKRRIAAFCSALNRSAYCVAHNSNTLAAAAGGEGEGWGCAQDDIEALLDAGYEPEDPVERACFAYARAATLDPANVPPELLERLAATLTPPQIVELACVVGFWKMYNTIHESLGVPIEAALLEKGRSG